MLTGRRALKVRRIRVCRVMCFGFFGFLVSGDPFFPCRGIACSGSFLSAMKAGLVPMLVAPPIAIIYLTISGLSDVGLSMRRSLPIWVYFYGV
jgi:hypothetical protein